MLCLDLQIYEGKLHFKVKLLLCRERHYCLDVHKKEKTYYSEKCEIRFGSDSPLYDTDISENLNSELNSFIGYTK